MADRDAPPRLSWVAVGCLLAPAGFFGGGIIAVAIGMFVGTLRGCKPPADLPACNTFEFLYSGALIGVLLLPGLAVWRLRRAPREPGTNGRS